MLFAVLADVGHVEPLRQIEVELDRRGLPFAADRVLDLQVDLRAVECAAALVDLALQPEFVDRLAQ